MVSRFDNRSAIPARKKLPVRVIITRKHRQNTAFKAFCSYSRILTQLNYFYPSATDFFILSAFINSLVTIHDFVNNAAEIYLIHDIAKSLAQPEIQIALAEIFA